MATDYAHTCLYRLCACRELRKQSVLNSIQNVPVLDDFQVLRFGVEDLLLVLGAAHWVLAHLLLHHLLAHLVGGCGRSAGQPHKKRAGE